MKIVAIQANALASLRLEGDSSLLLAYGMIQNHYKIFWYEPHNLSYRDDKVVAKGFYINVDCDLQKEIPLQYEILSNEIELNLSHVSCVMIRQDPPVNMNYIASTHLLSILQEKNSKIFIFNDSNVLRNEVEKLLPITIANNHIPPTIISNDIHIIKKFLDKHKEIVMKPIYGYGGNDVVKITTMKSVKEYLKRQQNMQVIVQKFLPEIYSGDKRIIICDGEIVGIVGRIPSDNSFLTNTCAGGQLKTTTINQFELNICQQIAIDLQKRNIFLAGIDMIGKYITEINITSPGLLMAMVQQNGYQTIESILKKIVNKFIKRVDKKTIE